MYESDVKCRAAVFRVGARLCECVRGCARRASDVRGSARKCECVRVMCDVRVCESDVRGCASVYEDVRVCESV